MPATNRVSPGYPKIIKESKQVLQRQIAELNKRVMTAEQRAEYLRVNTNSTYIYTDTNNRCIHIDIDFVGAGGVPISYFVEVSLDTGKAKLGSTVTVWLNKNDADGEAYWVDDYKW